MAAILVVDDRGINREFLAVLLGYAGHVIVEAADGAEALRIAREQRFDLVISDVLMPGMGGVELAKAMRADAALAATPIVFYTATYRVHEARQLATGCGVADVLAKPSEPELILATVAKVLGAPAGTQVAPADVVSRIEARLPGWPRPLAELQGSLQRALQAGEAADLPVPVPPPALQMVQRVSLRLAALLEVGLELSAESDSGRVLDMFCRATQDILGARYVGVCMLDNDRRAVRVWSARGLGTDARAALGTIDVRGPVVANVLSGTRICRVDVPSGDPGAADLPVEHPPVARVLLAPVRSAMATFGWFYAADRLDGAAFGTEDEQFAATLAAQLGLAYGSLVLREELQEHAGLLRLEIGERHEQQLRIQRLSRLRAVFGGVSSAILRVRDRDELLRAACRVAVTEGSFPMAWAGVIDAESGEGHVVAWAGAAEELRPLVRVSNRADPPYDTRPGSRAARSKRLVVVNEIASESSFGDLRDPLMARGFRSYAVCPLVVEERAVALVALASDQAHYFDDEERALLEWLRADLGYALEHIEKARRLDYLAYYDTLTGLPNPTLLRDRLSQMLYAAAAVGQQVGVMLADLERFSEINDTQGRAQGDTILRVVAERLGRGLAEPYTVARTGADSYALAVSRPGTEAAIALREHLGAALAAPIALEGRDVHVDAHAGIAMYPADGDDVESLLRNAEAALKRARATGERCLYYAPAMNAQMDARLRLLDELRVALGSDDLVLYYQPRLDLVSGDVVGAESLVRWQHPSRGLLLPGRFIGLAEESGLIVPLGRRLIRDACRQQARWLAEGLELVPISVNLSPLQFRSGTVLEDVRAALQEARLDARWLEIELTESAAMERPEEAVRVLRELRELGVRIALDDFGTGFSSLAHLRRFPLSAVKLDQTFVSAVTHNPEDAAIASAVIAMAHRLGLRVIAEGVETEAQMLYLRVQGCDEMQGFHFRPAVPAAQFELLLRGRERMALPSAPMGERTLLIVDDEPGIRSALNRALRRDGYRILTAESGEAALELLAREPVQVIVSDQRMPGMSGAEFLAAVKVMHPDTIRIILSGYTDLEVVTDAVNRGAVYKFLTKPWDDELLREQVRDAFRRHQAPAR